MSKDGAHTIARCSRDHRGRLIVRDSQGREYTDVRPVRMFPVTDPNGPISVCDAEYNELITIESIEAVPGESRRMFEEELNRYMFTPVILQIAQAVPVGENIRFSVETDRGATDVVSNPEDMYRLSENRILIKDLNGIRYLIPDRHNLNVTSRKILDMYT